MSSFRQIVARNPPVITSYKHAVRFDGRLLYRTLPTGMERKENTDKLGFTAGTIVAAFHCSGCHDTLSLSQRRFVKIPCTYFHPDLSINLGSTATVYLRP